MGAAVVCGVDGADEMGVCAAEELEERFTSEASKVTAMSAPGFLYVRQLTEVEAGALPMSGRSVISGVA